MKKLLILLSALALTFSLSMAEGKCNGNKCDSSKKTEKKCDNGKCGEGKKEAKKAPSKMKCGEGKCG